MRSNRPRQSIKRLVLALIGVAAAALLLAACGDSDSGGSTSGSSTNGASTSGSSTSSGGGGVSAAQDAVTATQGVPEFRAPGPAFDASRARGRTAMYIGIDMSIPNVKTISDAFTEAGRAAGVAVVTCDGKGNPSDQNKCMQQGVAQKVDAIVLESITSRLLAAPIKAARDAGIPVIGSTERDDNVPPQDPNLAGVTSFPYTKAGELMADWAIADSDGKANVVAIQAPDVPNGADVREGMESQFQENCPDCKLKIIESRVADWGDRLTTLTQTALTSDPTVDYVLPFYDGMAQFVVPAIRQAGAAERVKVASFNATPSVLTDLKNGNIVGADVGSGNDWLGWAEMDQALRLMTDNEPVQPTGVGLRTFDESNIGDIDLDADESTWYGDSYIDGYKQLWGLG